MISRRSGSNLGLVAAAVATLAGCAALLDGRTERREARAEATWPPMGELVTLPDGTRVHAKVTGTGPDLVLIHGANGNLRDFSFDLIDRLADDYRVIAFDRPAFGHSDSIGPDDASPVAQADVLIAAAHELGAESPIVLGHSYGGAVALGWALRAETPPAALTILSGASNPWPGGLGWRYRLTTGTFGQWVLNPLAAAFLTHTPADSFVETIFAPQDVPEGYLDHVGAGLALRRETLSANSRQIQALSDHLAVMSQSYGALEMPVEILHGTVDEIVPLEVHAEPLTAQLPDARLTRLDGIGHMPHHAVPEDVVAAIDRAAARAGLR